MKWRIVTLCVAAALIAGSAVAQDNSSNGLNESNGSDSALQMNQSMQGNIDTVLVASSESHIDATIADAASERLGIPVVLTDPEDLSQSTRQAMTDLEVEQAIIIGGPEALSDNVQQDINGLTSQETNRVYGQTASDTSVEVAEYFWPQGYDQATIVQAPLMEQENETYRLLSAVMNTADEQPVLLSDPAEPTDDVVSEIESQTTSEVRVYSVSEDANNTLLQGLNQLNIETSVEQGNVDDLTNQLYSEIQQNPEDRDLYALTGANYSYGIPTYADPNGATYVVTNETVNESVDYIGSSGFETVNLIGDQEVAGQLSTELNESVETNYIRVEDPARTSVDILSNNTEAWSTQADSQLIQEIIGTEQSENETETPTTENESENETPTETPADTETPTQESGTTEAQSSVGLTSNSSTVTAEASYTSDEAYTQVQDVETNQTHITITFELVPTADMPEQDQYNYNFNESLQPESGDYQTRAELVVNNRTVDTATGNAQIQ